MFTGEDQKSHFEDLQVPMEELRYGAVFALRSEVPPVTGLEFRDDLASCLLDFHNAPRRQLMITLTGAVELRVLGRRQAG